MPEPEAELDREVWLSETELESDAGLELDEEPARAMEPDAPWAMEPDAPWATEPSQSQNQSGAVEVRIAEMAATVASVRRRIVSDRTIGG